MGERGNLGHKNDDQEQDEVGRWLIKKPAEGASHVLRQIVIIFSYSFTTHTPTY